MGSHMGSHMGFHMNSDMDSLCLRMHQGIADAIACFGPTACHRWLQALTTAPAGYSLANTC